MICSDLSRYIYVYISGTTTALVSGAAAGILGLTGKTYTFLQHFFNETLLSFAVMITFSLGLMGLVWFAIASAFIVLLLLIKVGFNTKVFIFCSLISLVFIRVCLISLFESQCILTCWYCHFIIYI